MEREIAQPDCDAVDELAGAWALGALSADEDAAIAEHLVTCDRPHQELHDGAGVVDVLATALPEETPSPELRARIMRSLDAPAHRADVAPEPVALRRGRRSWLPPLAALAAAAALVLAAWNVQLRSEGQRLDASLAQLAHAVASGSAAYRATGSMGTGYVIDAPTPVLVASLPSAPPGSLYEMWLLDAAGKPVAVGTLGASAQAGLTVVQLERPLRGYATFAITVEAHRLDAPTGKPVLAATLPG